MAEPADKEGSDVKTAQDVLKMSGKDELKFGVLIGLIKVGQVTNKDVVETVLNLVSVLILYFLHVDVFFLHSLDPQQKWAGPML